MESENNEQGEFTEFYFAPENEQQSLHNERRDSKIENGMKPDSSDLSGTTFSPPSHRSGSFHSALSQMRNSHDQVSIRSNETRGSIVYVAERPILLQRVRTTTPAPLPWHAPSRILIPFLVTLGIGCFAGILVVFLHDFGVLKISAAAATPKSTSLVIVAPTVADSPENPIETVMLTSGVGSIAEGAIGMVVTLVMAAACMLLQTIGS